MINNINKSCLILNYKKIKMISGAGHDAVSISNKCPTGMIFIPCHKGISHSEDEFASDSNLEKGCNVLLQTVLNMGL